MTVLRMFTLLAFVVHATFGCGAHLRMECTSCSHGAETTQGVASSVAPAHCGHTQCGHAHVAGTSDTSRKTESPDSAPNHGNCYCGGQCHYVASRLVVLEQATACVAWVGDVYSFSEFAALVVGNSATTGQPRIGWSTAPLARCAELQRWLI